jgi:exosortase
VTTQFKELRPALSLTERTADIQRGWLDVPVRAWVMVGCMAALFIALYWTSLERLWKHTNPINGTKEWAHAIFVPVVGVYYLYLHLDELMKRKVKPLVGLEFTPARFISAAVLAVVGVVLWFVVPHLGGLFSDYGNWFEILGKGAIGLAAFVAVLDWGLGTLLAGLIIYTAGVSPLSNDLIKDFGMIMSVFGAVLTIGGWEVMKIAWFPCVFLLAIPPWPDTVYQKISIPLQNIASSVGVFVMTVAGIDAERNGTTMTMYRDGVKAGELNVATACSGLKSLMTFISLGAALAFLSNRPLWQKLFITAATVPIAIFCNAMRVGGQGLLDYYVSHEWSTGFAHMFAGVVFLLPGFLMILGLIWVLDQLFIDVEDTEVEGAVVAEAK